MKKHVLIIVILLVGLWGNLYSLDLKNKEYDFGITLGYWMSGDVDISGYTAQKDGSFLFRVFTDAYLMPKLAMGVYFNFSPIGQEGIDFNILEFGGSIKPRFFVKEDIAIKPGINFGYRITTSDYEEAETDGFGLNLSIEIQKALDSLILSFEGGFLAQPTGGNEWIEFTWAPIMYIGGGITF